MKAQAAKAQAAAGTPMAASVANELQKKWIVVYPCYLDKARSVSDGNEKKRK
jgi:hypothetical protein